MYYPAYEYIIDGFSNFHDGELVRLLNCALSRINE